MGFAAALVGTAAAADKPVITRASPIDRLTRPDKTELTDKDSNVAAAGGEFGIPWMWWWHRINAGWGTVRPRVAELICYDQLTGQTMTVQGGSRTWTPNHLHQEAELNGLKLVEDKSVLGDSLADVLQIRNVSSQRRSLKLYFAGQPDAHSPGNPDSHALSISFDAARNALLLTEEKDYGKHYLPGHIVVKQWIGSSTPIVGWAVGTFPGDIDKFYGRDLGMGAFINDANLRKYGDHFSGERFEYAFQVNIDFAPGETRSITLATTFGTSEDAAAEINRELVRRAPELIAANAAAWRDYFEKEIPDFQSPDEDVNRLWDFIGYVLRSNSVKRGRAVTSDFTVPTKFGYWGCYIWDSAFHGLGQQHLRDPQVAENSIRAILSIEYPNGFLPVNAGADDVEVNTPDDGTFDLDPHDFYRYTEDANPFLGELEYRSPQPHQWGVPQTIGRITIQEKTMLPILGLAAWQIYLTTGDRQFLSETYGSLSRYDDWLWRRRNSGDGLLVWYNPEESGWDNASRLLPLPVKTVDGSTMAFLLRQMLAQSAKVLGRDDDAARYADRAALTARSINAKMWDDRTGFYYDLSMDDRQRPQKSPAGFTPLMTGTVAADRVALLAAHLQNPHEFATGAPVPSLSRDDPQFDTRTWGWNGPTWIPSNWLVMESFARAGRTDLSNALMQSMAAMMTGPDGFPRTYEQYDSESGVPFGVADYSWSGAVDDYLVRWVAGIQPAADQGKLVIAPRLLAGWKWFEIGRVHIGQDDVGYRYDISAQKQQIRVQNTGPAPLQIDLVLPVKQPPRSVMLDGQAMQPSAYRIEAGELHMTLPSGAIRNVEVLNP